MNPMLNPVVLNNFFEVIGSSETHRLRWICAEWFKSSRIAFHLFETVQIGHPLNVLQWDNIHEKFQPAANLPFCNFHLVGFEFMNQPYPSSPMPGSLHLEHSWWIHQQSKLNHALMYRNMESFIGQYGPQIQRLKMSWPSIFSIDAFKVVIFESLPNLVELALLHVERNTPRRKSYDEDYRSGSIHFKLQKLTVCAFPLAVPWKTLLFHFPNLKQLHLQPKSSVGCVVQSLRNLESTIQLTNLIIDNKENICSDWDPNYLTLMEMPQCELVNLEINVERWKDGGQQALERIMHRHGTNLQQLAVKVFTPFLPENGLMNPNNCFPFIYDMIPLMTKLKLQGYACNNFEFMLQFPNLSELILTSCFPEILQRTNMQLLQNLTMPQLRVFQVDHFLHQGFLQILVSAAPGLESFKGDVSATGFGLICGGWSNLMKLYVTSGCSNEAELDWIDNEALTGIINGQQDRSHNLTSLLALKIAHIQSMGEISDKSVWELMEMEQLEELQINLASETTDEAFYTLVDKFVGRENCAISRDEEPKDY